MYKVHFRLKDMDYELVAESLDLSHPYFVSIKDIDLAYEEGVVVNPHLENTKKRFKDVANIMIPLQNVALIETVPAKARINKSGVKLLKMQTGDERSSGSEDS